MPYITPLYFLNGTFNITTSGRTLTPVGIVQGGGADDLMYPDPANGALTLAFSSPDPGHYDLAIIRRSGTTYGLTTYPLGQTPTMYPGVWYIGTVYDYISISQCTALLTAGVPTDQYFAMQQTGLHVKVFPQQSYSILNWDSPGGLGNLKISQTNTQTTISSSTPTSIGTGGGLGGGQSLNISCGDFVLICDVSVTNADQTFYASRNISLQPAQAGAGNLILGSSTGIAYLTAGTLSAITAIPDTVSITVKDTNFTLEDDGDVTKKATFQLSGITTGTTRVFTFPNTSGTLVTQAFTQTLSNKTLDNSNTVTLTQAAFTLQNDGDTTKQWKFQLSGIATATTRTWTVPDASDTFTGTTATQTLTNKTLTSVVLNATGTGTQTVTATNAASATVALATFAGGTTNAQTVTLDKNAHVAFSQTATPTAVLGTGAGTGAGTAPSVAFLAGSTDQAGLIQLTTGTQVPAGGNATIMTITFATAMAVKPFTVAVFPTIASAHNLAAGAYPAAYFANNSTTQWAMTSGNTGLTISTLYQWVYIVF